MIWIWNFGDLTAGSLLVIQLSLPIGYALVGVAWWQWTPISGESQRFTRAMRHSSRTLALASAVIALGYLAQLYGDLRFRYELPDHGRHNFDIPHWNLSLVGYGAAGLGLLLAAMGFWFGSNVGHRPDPLPMDSGMTGMLP